ncbi:MAG: hypothetical protein ACP5SG_05860 [Dissulfurimicrobium sp.]|uniref:hypothetical protein n=1 Tax=Dissulfurimicrobium TaxID=1769732 RepID=UPI001EDA087F|nr:hypothetical protein [Dissulfurimicrobium hydrothermale]UKL13026.1 hypothetical protein LGS26_05880 [Dissulfurimicrobium hydrothermale]
MTTIEKSKGKIKSGKAVGYICLDAFSYYNRRIVCPTCGNDRHFYEIAEDVMLTTRYTQNPDGSFTPQSDESRILGEVKLYCGECQTDMSQFHSRFMEMLF